MVIPVRVTCSERHSVYTYDISLSVKQSIEVTVAPSEVGELQYLPIWREFWLDPEREQHRKSYVEESFLESYFVAIRCPDNAQECAGLAKE